MLREWFSAKELAGLGDLPNTKKGVLLRAHREGWKSQKRTGRGGGFEFHISSLPLLAQAALLKRHGKEDDSSHFSLPKPEKSYCRESLWAAFDKKNQRAKDKASHKLNLLNQAMVLHENGEPLRESIRTIANLNGMSHRTIEGWYYGSSNKLGVQHYERDDWLAALAPGYTGRVAVAECDIAAWEFYKADYLRLEKPAASACYQRLLQASKSNHWSIPSEPTMRRKLERDVPLSVRVLLRDGEHALMRMYPAQQRSIIDLHALEWINGDGYQHNVFVQ